MPGLLPKITVTDRPCVPLLPLLRPFPPWNLPYMHQLNALGGHELNASFAVQTWNLHKSLAWTPWIGKSSASVRFLSLRSLTLMWLVWSIPYMHALRGCVGVCGPGCGMTFWGDRDHYNQGPGSQGPRSPDPLAVDDVRPLSRSSSRDSPDPPSSPPLTATLFQMFRALESRKRQREEEYVSLKRMKLEHREMQKQREERERERWHEREMLRLQIQLEQYKREDPTAGAALASAVGGGPVGLGVGVGDDHDESTPIAGPSHTLALTQAHGGASSQPPQQQPSDIPHSALTQHGTHLAHLGVGVGAAHLESHERAASGGPGSTAGGGGGGGDDSSQQNPIHTPQPQSQSHSHHPRLSTLDVGHHSHIPHHLIESLGSAGGPQSAAPLNPPGSAVQSALMSPGNAALDALTSLREGTGSGGLR
ncbi:hypothetical protein DL93DRAFT_110299 [Clavulina sp. PMI_390]|nr:hypothetical protein DL93DRAFT_110299 [Clavulina sp. PMI_390]